jgi:hypothetical protein
MSLSDLVKSSSAKETFFFEMVYLVEIGVEIDSADDTEYTNTALEMLIIEYYTGSVHLKNSIYYLLSKGARVSMTGYQLAVSSGDLPMMREMRASFTAEFIQLVLDGCYAYRRNADRLMFLVETGVDLKAKCYIPVDRKMLHFSHQASMCELILNFYFSLPTPRPTEVENVIVLMLTKGAPVDNYCLVYASTKGSPKVLEELLKYNESKRPVYYLGRYTKEVIEGFGRIAYSPLERHLYETAESNPFEE